MATKHIHFPQTTAQQRKLLFETWEETGNVTEACRKAHVGRGTFYYWKPRFDERGYSGLEEFASRAPKEPHRTSAEVEEKVIALRRGHPDWGKKRIADELAKGNNWVPLVSPNTVRRILKDAGLWETAESGGGKRRDKPVGRTAEQPGETVNVDLCFVPATHEVESKLPAVSGSSGRLVVERPSEGRKWAGQVFEDPALTYEEAMSDFVAASRKRAREGEKQTKATGDDSTEVQKRTLRREEAQMRDERRRIREQRKLEDAAWKETRATRQAEERDYWALTKGERRQQRKVKQRRDEQWRTVRDQRRATLEQRRREDEDWRQKRLELRRRKSELPVITTWIAVLVIVDNCTRQCLGLPLFVAGSKVTSEMVAEALCVLLPPELQFLISDRGVHFTANAFQKVVVSEGFIHVLIARHRPQSNGIAERFVRTLKEWLASRSWQDEKRLGVLLEQFLGEYNDRPHQGLAIPGLSPDEFARRIWLM